MQVLLISLDTEPTKKLTLKTGNLNMLSHSVLNTHNLNCVK